MTRRVALLRHGQTAWNAARRIQGTTDIALDDIGRGQAWDAGTALAAMGTWSFVISSPLLRARETGAIIAAHLGLPLQDPLPALSERDCGDAEGLAVDEAHARWPDLDYPGSETFAAVGRRTADAVARISATANGAIVVGHGIALRSAIAVLTGEPMRRLTNAEAIVLEVDEAMAIWRRVEAAAGRGSTADPEPLALRP